MATSGFYTAAALADLMARRLEVIAARIGSEDRTVRVMGQLLEVPPAHRSGVIYDAPLVDPIAPTKVVLLEVHPSTLLEVRPGDTVIAYGSIVTNLYKGQLKLRLRADRVELAEPPEERERRLAELPILETVRQAGGVRHSFPRVPSPTVALLCAGASAVKRDFLEALGPLRAELRIREVDVSMASPEDIAAAIRGVREEVMVLIRGGGDDADFRVFETRQVIEALGECAGFRVLGLGHSDNRTLADCVADYTANVPAEAGRFLLEQVWKARLQSKQDRLQSEYERLQSEYERLQSEHERQAAVIARRHRVLSTRRFLVVLVTAAILLGLLLLPFH